jgi:general nucleoside transport system ATP-binding protein
MEKTYAVEFKNISKYFGSVVANSKINMTQDRGEIRALLGENGSGKTTLMNMLSGIYFPDEGEIFVDGKPASIKSPSDAFNYGIGMIHQHFKLVDIFSAAENIILGNDNGKILHMKSVIKKLDSIVQRYGFDIDLKKKTYDMSVSEKQTVEIIKALYRGSNILILDEPTAVLTPQETEKLFQVLRKMKEDNKSIIIITHKFHEVFAISDKVSVLRKGKYIDTVNTKDMDEMKLTEMMVGKKIELNINRPLPKNIRKRMELLNVSAKDKYGVTVLDDVSFDINSGEILGIAGIAGSGQKELLEAITGLQAIDENGVINYISDMGNAIRINGKTTMEIKQLGVSLAFVPEDRLGMGLVGNMGMADNMMLRSYQNGRTIFTDRKAPLMLAEKVKNDLEVVTPGISSEVRKLSGGNVQKVLVGREIADNPNVLLTAYAVRGLDINTSYLIYNLLTEQKQCGSAVVYVGEDLDVLIALCDRILVLCGGSISGILDAKNTTKEEVGLLMTKKRKEQKIS